MTSSGRFVTVFLYALYRIVLVFRHLFFCNVRAANLLWPETSGLITASRVHGQVSYSDFLNIFSPCLFNRSLNNAANLFPFLFNHEAGKLIIFSRILQFIVCRRGKKSYLQSWARALLPLFNTRSTLMRFQKYAFSLSWKTHRSFRVHTTVLKRFRLSKLIWCVCVFVLIRFQERFKIDAFLMKTLSVLVWTEGLNASKCTRFQTCV